MKGVRYIFIVLLFGVLSLYGCGKEPYDGWILRHYGDASGNQGMFYSLYKPSEDYLILVDGGWDENTESVRSVIKEYGGKVDAWFLTHYHNDHVSAFNNIWEDPQGIEIRAVYDSPMDPEEYMARAEEWDRADCFERYLRITKGDTRVRHLYRDDKLTLSDLSVEVFNSYDEIAREAAYDKDLHNNASLVLRFQGQSDSILFLGDVHTEAMHRMLYARYGERLKSTYVQLGHHGNNTAGFDIYPYISARTAFFDAPEWLMTGENYHCAELKAYLEGTGCSCRDYTDVPQEFEFH